MDFISAVIAYTSMEDAEHQKSTQRYRKFGIFGKTDKNGTISEGTAVFRKISAG